MAYQPKTLRQRQSHLRQNSVRRPFGKITGCLFAAGLLICSVSDASDVLGINPFETDHASAQTPADAPTVVSPLTRIRLKKRYRIESFFNISGTAETTDSIQGYTSDLDFGIDAGIGVFKHQRSEKNPALFTEHGFRFTGLIRDGNSIYSIDHYSGAEYKAYSIAYVGAAGMETPFPFYAMARYYIGCANGRVTGEDVTSLKTVVMPYAGVSADLGVHLLSTISMAMSLGLCASPTASYSRTDGVAGKFSLTGMTGGMTFCLVV